MQFGCFVQLEGVAGRVEGLVHISEVRCYTVSCCSRPTGTAPYSLVSICDDLMITPAAAAFRFRIYSSRLLKCLLLF